VQRLIQPVGIIFKGSGFYVTDNRSKSSTSIPSGTRKSGDASSESKAESASDSTSGSTSSSKTESSA